MFPAFLDGCSDKFLLVACPYWALEVWAGGFCYLCTDPGLLHPSFKYLFKAKPTLFHVWLTETQGTSIFSKTLCNNRAIQAHFLKSQTNPLTLQHINININLFKRKAVSFLLQRAWNSLFQFLSFHVCLSQPIKYVPQWVKEQAGWRGGGRRFSVACWRANSFAGVGAPQLHRGSDIQIWAGLPCGLRDTL